MQYFNAFFVDGDDSICFLVWLKKVTSEEFLAQIIQLKSVPQGRINFPWMLLLEDED